MSTRVRKPNEHHHSVIANIIKHHKCEKIIEVGIWKSGLIKHIMSKHPVCYNIIKEYYAVDQWRYLGDGHGRMGERSQDNWDLIHLYACEMMVKWFPQLRVIRSDSAKAASIFPDRYADLIYIDANHYYRHVMADIKAWLSKVKNNGLFMGHDYNEPNHTGVKQAVDEMFSEDGITFLRPSSIWIKKNES